MKTILDMLRKSTTTAKIGLFIVLVWILCAVFAPFISPHDPEAVDIMQRMKPPAWQDGGSMEHVLGTDEMGRDVLSRLIYGARISLVIGVCSVVVGMTIGVVLGLLAGYIGGWVDAVIMRLVDMMLAFPFTFLALCLVAVLGSSLENVIIVLGITGWASYTRTVRAQVLSVREREFIRASTTIGCKDGRILFKHILPSVIDSAIILATMEMGSAILSEASLTFLGMGVPPSIPTWGNMISSGRQYIYTAWWLTTLPGLAIFIVCLGINFIGDWARDIRDPRLRGVK